jgi:hypothetical protein
MADADDSVNDVIQQALAGLRRLFRPARALLNRSRLLRWLRRLTQSQRHRVGTETVRDTGAWDPVYDAERQLNGAQARYLNVHRDLQAREADLRDLQAQNADLQRDAAQKDRDLQEARGDDNDAFRDPNSNEPFVVQGEVVDSRDTPLDAEHAAHDADEAATDAAQAKSDAAQAESDAAQAKEDRAEAQETADQSPGAAGTVAEVAAAEAVAVEAEDLRDRAEEQAETDSDELAEADQKEDFEQESALNEKGVIEPVGPEAPRDPEVDSQADEVDSPAAEADEVDTSADEVDAPGLDANEVDSLAAEADGVDADGIDADGIDRPAGEVDAQGQDFQQQSELNEKGVIEPVGQEAPRDPEVDSPTADADGVDAPAAEADGVDAPAAQANGVDSPAAQADAQDQDFQQQTAMNEHGVIEPAGAEAPRVDEPDQQQETGESGPALPTATDERDRSERNEQNAQQAGQSGPAVDPPVEDYAIADQKAAMSNNPGAQQNRTGGPKEMSDGDRNHLRHQVGAGVEPPGASAPVATPAASQESSGNGERSYQDRQLANQGSGRGGPSQGSSGPPARGE